jgi:hypothetical protein
MANAHITAAFHCSQFKGTTRLVLLYLADAASPLSKKDAKEQKKLPFGFCKRRLSTIMCALNIHRQPTITKAISELKAAGAIQQRLKKGASPMYFLDLEWLKSHEFTDDEIASFSYDALREAREQEKHAEAMHNADPDDTVENLFPTREPPVSHGSEHGGTPATPAESMEVTDTRWLPASDPPYGEPSETLDQRKPFNPENGKRLTSDTESAYPSERKAFNSTHLVPTPALRLGDFDPPSCDGLYPTASRTKHSHKSVASLEEQHQDQHQEQPPSLQTAEVDPPVPVHSQPPQAREIPPPAPRSHYWPAKDRTDETPCKYCGSLYRDRYDREEVSHLKHAQRHGVGGQKTALRIPRLRGASRPRALSRCTRIPTSPLFFLQAELALRHF